MALILGSTTVDSLERRLRKGGPVSAGEIIAAVGAAGSSRRAARLRGWAAQALKRCGNATSAQYVSMLDSAASAATQGR